MTNPFPSRNYYSTISFNVSIVRNDTTIFNYTNQGGLFDITVKTNFNSLRPKDILIFNDWVISAPEGRRKINEIYKLNVE